MPKRYRVSQVEFKLMRGFRRLAGVYFSLSYGRIPGRSNPGGAIVVSSKAVAGAVARNNLRRRSRAILVDLLKESKSGAVFVLHARKGAGTSRTEDLRADISDVMARAGEAR